jgi:lipid-A-disaccharide synthase
MKKNILIITGEPSGDLRGAELARELNKKAPGLKIWGIGGDQMREEGVDLTAHIKDFSIIGLWSVITSLGKIHRQFRDIKREILERSPDIAVLIDYPGFNLRIAAFLKKQGIPVVYYVIPQVWAWGSRRAEKLGQLTDKLLVLFNFEKEFLAARGIESIFVGHPILDNAPEIQDMPKEKLTIALLPGSRVKEVKRMLPPIMDAAGRINAAIRDDIRFIIAKNASVPETVYEASLLYYEDLDIHSMYNNTFGALAESDLAIVTSGTATLETAVMEKPLVLTYKLTPFSYFVAKRIVSVKYVGLVNIIAGKEIAPECIQDKATGENIAECLLPLIQDNSLNSETRHQLREVKKALGEKGAARRAAEEIVKML